MTVATHDLLNAAPYEAYAYSYPHKLAYRPFDRPLRLRDIWAKERRESLLMYVHVPFCEMRCGFCNLFTKANAADDEVAVYLAALARQADAVRGEIGDVGVARICLGGGTPTFLSAAQLAQLFDTLDQAFDTRPTVAPTCVETSPATADRERLDFLKSRGIERLSIGVQSFIDGEVHGIGRPQQRAEVHAALARIRDRGFRTLNVDLMYGLPGQTAATWQQSLHAALEYSPEEIYLYPLYVRPLTGLGKLDTQWNDVRLDLYRRGRDLLLGDGYEQLSMRMFRCRGAKPDSGPAYSCQLDGTIGLGPGARNYTASIHYSTRYAVGRAGVARIIDDYAGRPQSAFTVADYGFRLDEEEQRRRYVLQSLLEAPGLDLNAYRQRFVSDAFDDVPQLHELPLHGLAEIVDGALRLTASGLERSDAIGPWLYSEPVKQLIRSISLT